MTFLCVLLVFESGTEWNIQSLHLSKESNSEKYQLRQEHGQTLVCSIHQATDLLWSRFELLKS